MRDNGLVIDPEPAADTQVNPPATPADNAPDGAAAHPTPRPRKVLLFGGVALIVVALDVISKVLVAAKLPIDHEPVRILGGVIYLDQLRNPGAAFSQGTGMTAILTVLAAVVVVVIIRYASRMRSAGWAVALGLVLGGALGNLIDRLFRSPGIGRGRVVDWISLFGPNAVHWPVFNLADAAICCGAALAAILALLGIDFNGDRGR